MGGGRAQINKIRNLKREVTMDLWNYNKQLYTKIMDNLEERGKFLDRSNLPRLNQEETESMNK